MTMKTVFATLVARRRQRLELVEFYVLSVSYCY